MTESTTTLDVRTIIHRERHSLIFTRLDALAPGEAILLVNDHDPNPLHRQLTIQRPEQFAWEPQEEGPEEALLEQVKRIGERLRQRG